MAVDTSSEDLQDQLEEQQSSSSGGYDSTQMQIDQMLSAGWPQAGGQQASAAQAPPPPSPYAQPAPQQAPLTPAAYQPPAQYAPAPTQALAGARVQPYRALPTTPPPPLPAPAFMQPQQPPPGAVGMVTDVPFAQAGYQMSPEETAAQGQPNIPEPEDKSGFWATEGKALGRGLASAVQSIVPYVTQTVSSVAGGLATMVEQGIGGAGTQTDPNSPSRFLDPSMPFGAEGQQVTPQGPSKVAEVEKNVYSAVTNKANEVGEWVNQQLPPTIKSFADIKSGGDALTYVAERLTEMAPQLAVFAAAPGAGQGALAASLPFAAVGALYGFDKARRETNGDNNAIAESMLANSVLMGGAPALLATTAGKGLIRNIATAGGINAILGAAGAVQNQTPQAIAQAKSFGDFLDKMGDTDWKQLAEGAVTGAVQGVLIGGVGTYLHPGEVKPTDTSTRDVTKVIPGNPADVDQQVALNQALKVPGTTSDTFRTVEQGNVQPPPTAGAAPPAMALNPTLPGLPATAADRGIGQPPPPPPPPGAPLVRGPADLAAQAATVEQARQQAAGTEGDVIPGAAGPAPPAPPPPPPPPMGARQIPEQPGMPGATQAGLPGVEPPPVQPELPLQPGSRLPPQAPGGGPPDGGGGGGTGLPLGDQPQLPFGRAVPEQPITPIQALPRPVEGVPPEARQGELPAVEPAPAQGTLREMSAETRAPAQPVLGGDPNQRTLPLEDQPRLPAQTLADKLQDHPNWRIEPDDQTPGQYVVKHGNDVLSVGSSPEEALAMAHQRAEAARRAAPAEAVPTVGSEEGPAGAAGPEGAAAAEAAPAGEVATLEKPAEQASIPSTERHLFLENVQSGWRISRGSGSEVARQIPDRDTAERMLRDAGYEHVSGDRWDHQRISEPKAVKEAVAQAKAKGEPVGVALVTREQLRKKLGITPERGNVAVAEGTAPEFKTVEEGNVAPTKRPSRMAQQAKAEMAIRSGETGAARDIPGAVEGKKTAPTSDYKALYRSRAKEIAAGTNFVDQVMRELPPTGTRGPQRESFVKYLHDRLVEARDPKTISDLQEQQQRARTPTAKGRIEDDIQFYKDLREHQAEIQQQIGESLEPRPEGAAALKSAEDELDAELARIKADKAAKHNAPPSPERQVANRFSTPGVDEPVKAIYDRIAAKDAAPGATRESVGTSMHEVLDAIANNSRMGTAGLQQARVLAAILKSKIPASTRVITEDSAHLFGLERPASSAYYDPRRDVVVIRTQGGGADHAVAALHEAVHAATAHYIQNAERAQRIRPATAGRGEDLTRLADYVGLKGADPAQARHVEALRVIHDEVARIFNSEGHTFSPDETDAWLHALKDSHELAAVLLTDPQVQDRLAHTTSSPEFQREMERLGYNKDERPNLWAAFRGFLRRIFNVPSGADNVLGHAMRALSDVVDTGARYRREPAILRGIQDARLRSAVELGGHVLSAPPLTERARDMVTEQVARGRSRISESLRRGEMNGDNVDAIVRANRDLFPGGELDAHRASIEKGAAVTKEQHSKYRDQWAGIDASVARLPDNMSQDLGAFSNEVGYADASMRPDAAANAHLTKSEDLQTLQGLQARWNEMPDELKRLYEARRDFHEGMNAESRKADLDQLMRYMVPESTAQDRAAAQGQFATRSGTRAFLADPDASPFAEAMSDRYNRSRAAVRMIGNYMDLAHVQGDYLPLRRHGDYIVTYGDRGTTDSPYGVHFFENRYDAEKARAQFQAEGKEPGEVFSKASRQGLRRVSPAELGALEQELVRQGRTPEEAASVRDVYATMLLKRVGDRTAARMGARREGVLGASTDMRRIDNEAYQNHAAHMGAMASMVERNQTLEQMQIRRDYLHRNGGGDPVRAQDVIDQLRKRMPTDDQTRFLNGTNANRIGKGLSNFGFIYTLLRPARMPLELVGMHAMNQAMLGGKYGAGVSIRATANASRLAGFGGSLRLGLPNMLNQMRGHINKVNWESSGVVAQRMIENGANPELVNKMRQALVDANLVDTSHAQVAAEMARANSNWNKVATLQDRTLGAFAQMDNAVETMARMVFAHAAAELELAKNRDGNLDRAVEAAVEHSRVVNPNWNAYNAPWVASSQGPLGALARPLFQFRNFGLHQFGLYANLIREAYRGGDEGQRATAIKQLAGIVAYHALVGGLAVPGVEEVAKLLLGAADWVTGRRTPHDLDRIIRTHLADLMGPMAAQVATKGVLSLAGIDPSSSVGLHNLLQFPEFRDLTASEMAKNLAYMIVPASGQNIEQVAGAVQNFIRSGNPMALKNALPRMPRDLVGAYQMGTQGITDSRGKVILPSSQLSTGDIIAKAVGLRSTAESNFQEGRSAILDYQNVEKDERTRIINQAVASGNVGSVAAAVSKFNRDYPANPIKYDTLLKAQQEARQSTLTYGIRVPPKQVQDIRQQTRYLPQ